MLLETLSTAFRKARSVNQTSNGYVSKVPTGTEPDGDAGTATGSAIINLAKGGAGADNAFLAVFYGTGSDNNTFSCRAIGWRVLGNLPASCVWVPVPLFEVQVTLTSTQPGVAGCLVVATELFADTITITGTTANAGVGVNVNSPANNTIGFVVADLGGAQKLELTFTTGGSATDCNALVALL